MVGPRGRKISGGCGVVVACPYQYLLFGARKISGGVAELAGYPFCLYYVGLA